MTKLTQNIVPGSAEAKKVPTITVDIWYQSAYRTQLHLTALADRKANILISVNGLILTGVVATHGLVNIAPGLPTYLPLVVMTSSFTSLLLAILAAMPRDSLRQVKFNVQKDEPRGLLYFNRQACFTEDEYDEAMSAALEDPGRLRSEMNRHLYHLGLVLRRKYRMLRISYLVFLVGLMITVVLIAFLMTQAK